MCEFGDGWGELEISGCRPLHFAVGNGNIGCVELLMEYGAKGYTRCGWEGGSSHLPLPVQDIMEYEYGLNLI